MRNVSFLTAALCLSMTAVAAPTPPPPSCEAAEHRHFDFWVGDWEVVAPETAPNAGTVLGRNRIERMAAGCGLLENWTGASGFQGKSLNGWDAAHKTWRQFWVGSDGLVLRLEGGLVDGAMVMTGELPRSAGGVQRQRVSWTPQAGGGLVQHWQTSDDEGATWATSFLGIYRRAAAK